MLSQTINFFNFKKKKALAKARILSDKAKIQCCWLLKRFEAQYGYIHTYSHPFAFFYDQKKFLFDAKGRRMQFVTVIDSRSATIRAKSPPLYGYKEACLWMDEEEYQMEKEGVISKETDVYHHDEIELWVKIYDAQLKKIAYRRYGLYEKKDAQKRDQFEKDRWDFAQTKAKTPNRVLSLPGDVGFAKEAIGGGKQSF